MKNIFILFLLSLFIWSCGDVQVEDNPPKNNTEIVSDTVQILELTKSIVGILKEGDLRKLAPYIHPEMGVRFSPYATIDTASDMTFSAVQLGSLSKEEIYEWGAYDGSGEPMKLSVEAYHKKFIYDYDFIEPDSIFFNEVRQYGNSPNNVLACYPGCKFVEYYFSGKEEEYEGFDWRSLRLVFDKKDKEWKLVGIIHAEWTI